MLLLLARAFQSALPGMWPSPPEAFPLSSFAGHLLVGLGIVEVFWNWPGAFFSNILIVVALLYWIAKPENRISPAITCIWFTLYFLSFNALLGHDYHSLVGFLLLPLPFLFRKRKRYLLAWEFNRYYFVYLMVSAALWKIFRGTAFSPDHFSELLFQQQALNWALAPNRLFHKLGIFLFQNPGYAQMLFAVVVFAQLSFMTALFTRRFDKLLSLFFLCFTLFNQLVMGVFSWPLLVFLIPFLAPVRKKS